MSRVLRNGLGTDVPQAGKFHRVREKPKTGIGRNSFDPAPAPAIAYEHTIIGKDRGALPGHEGRKRGLAGAGTAGQQNGGACQAYGARMKDKMPAGREDERQGLIQEEMPKCYGTRVPDRRNSNRVT